MVDRAGAAVTQTSRTERIAVVDLRRQVRSNSLKAFGRALRKSVLIGLSTFAIVLAIWLGVQWFGGISPYIMKTVFSSSSPSTSYVKTGNGSSLNCLRKRWPSG